MYPNISYLLNDLFGVYIPLPIQTFGFFVALAFIFSSWTLALELKRKEKIGLIKAVKRPKAGRSKNKYYSTNFCRYYRLYSWLQITLCCFELLRICRQSTSSYLIY